MRSVSAARNTHTTILDCRCSARHQKAAHQSLCQDLQYWSRKKMVLQAALMAIIVLDGLAFIAFCTAIYLRKTCTPRRQKDVRWALRIAYVCMFVLGVICVATIGASPAAAAIAGVLLGNAAALMVADFLVPRCFTLDTHTVGADTPQEDVLRDAEAVT